MGENNLWTRASRFPIPLRLRKATLMALCAMVGPLAVNGAEQNVIAGTTLVAWVAPANLTPRRWRLPKADGKLWSIYHQQKDGTEAWNRFICIDPLWFDEQGVLHGKATRGTPEPAPAVKKR